MTENNSFPFQISEERDKEVRSERYIAEMENVYYHIMERNTPNLKKIERFFQRWKQYPEPWNWYYIALAKNKRNTEARKLLEKTIEHFPDYLFARCNQAALLIEDGKLDEAMFWLGETPDLQRLYPHRTSFMEVEILNYYKTFIYWEIERGNLEQAEKYLNICETLDGDEKNLARFRSDILDKKLEKTKDSFAPHTRIEQEYKQPAPPPGYSHKPFVNKEIEAMLDDAELYTKEQIDAILSLPRQTLIADLEQVLYRTMYEYTEDDFEKENFNLLPHALWLLYELRAYESEPIICCILEMSGEASDYWFGDYIVDYTWFVFFILLEKNPALTLETLRKPNLDVYTKSAALDGILHLALYYPENKTVYEGWIGDLLQFCIDNLDNEGFFDADFNGFIEHTVLELQARSLLPKLKILHDANAIAEFHCGDYERVLIAMDEKRVFTKKEKLPTIYELVEKENALFQEYNQSLKDKEEDDDDEYWTKSMQPTDEKPFPKTGRNEPCPCGSGKKYKKCCGK